MFGLLGGANQSGISLMLFDQFFAFLDNPFHRFAPLALWFLSDYLKNLFEPLDLGFGLFQVFFERVPQVFVLGRLGHLGQGFQQLFLSVVNVP
jgi:hypothetical protein